MFPGITGELVKAFWQTLWMVFGAGAFAVLGGLPLGVLLFVTEKGGIWEHRRLYVILGACINVVRSIPFIILLIAIIPFTRLIVGSSIGTMAAVVPLALAALPFVGRVVEAALREVPSGLLEAGHAMGATPWQIVIKILLPESRAAIVRGITLMLVTLVGYSAMAGAVGGGGLGDFAIRYGYQRFDGSVMLITVLVLIVVVQVMQYSGDWLANRLAHQRG